MCSFYPSRVKRYRFVALSFWHTWVEGRILRGQQNKPIKGKHTIYLYLNFQATKNTIIVVFEKLTNQTQETFPSIQPWCEFFSPRKVRKCFCRAPPWQHLATIHPWWEVAAVGGGGAKSGKPWRRKRREKICGRGKGGLWGGKGQVRKVVSLGWAKSGNIEGEKLFQGEKDENVKPWRRESCTLLIRRRFYLDSESRKKLNH